MDIPLTAVVKKNLNESMIVNNICAVTEEELNGGADTSSPISEETGDSHSHKDKMNVHVWLPPETDEPEHDMAGSISNYYDDEEDDECDDGIKWGTPSSLSSFGEQGSGSYKYKQEKQKAMNDVMNSKFKALVGNLLKSMGIVSSGKDDENWVDIVTSLSWEAALFVKPDTSDGKAMDPDGYVKIKCVATGYRSER